MLSRNVLIGLVLLLGGPAASSLADPVLYNVFDLGMPDGFDSSHALDINNQGQIVGFVKQGSSQRRGFLYENGVLSIVTVEGRQTSEVAAINNNGVMTGQVRDAFVASKTLGFVKGNSIEITFAPLDTGNSIILHDINDAGVVVGESTTVSSSGWRAFRWENGTVTNLGALNDDDDVPTSVTSVAYGINTSGQITGSFQASALPFRQPAFLYENGAMTDIGILPGYYAANAYGINDAGVIVGEAVGSGNTFVAFKYENGQMISLGALNGWRTAAYDINNHGVIVGIAAVGMPQSSVAFIYIDDQMIDLNTLIPADSGWHLLHANAINDLGQIVGWGLFNGQERAFLLSPIPEPASLMLMGAGLLVCLRRKRN